MLLSALVCPGAGQFVQKRWLAGILYGAGFIWGFCWFMMVAGKVLIDFYRMGFDFFNYEPAMPQISDFIPPLTVAFLFYLVNLIDVFIAQQRISRIKREEDFAKESLTD